MQPVRHVSSSQGGEKTEIYEVVRSVIGSVLCPAAPFASCVFREEEGGKVPLSGSQQEQPHHSSTEKVSSHQQAQSVSLTDATSQLLTSPADVLESSKKKKEEEGKEILKMCQKGKAKKGSVSFIYFSPSIRSSKQKICQRLDTEDWTGD